MELDPCDADLAGLEPISSIRFPNAPYGEPEEYGPYTAEIVLGLYRLEGRGER